MCSRFCLSLVLGGALVVGAAAMGGSPPPTPERPQPPSRLVVPRRTAAPVRRFATEMPIDMVIVIPENQLPSGAGLPPLPGPELRVDAPNARLRTYVTPMPIVPHGVTPSV